MSYEQPLCTLFSKEYRFFHHEDLASWEGFHNSKYCTHLSFNHSIAFSNLSWLFETGSTELSKLYWQRISLKLWDFPLISMNLIDQRSTLASQTGAYDCTLHIFMPLVPIVAHIKCVMLYLVTTVHWHESDTATDRIRCPPWPTKQGPTVVCCTFLYYQCLPFSLI